MLLRRLYSSLAPPARTLRPATSTATGSSSTTSTTTPTHVTPRQRGRSKPTKGRVVRLDSSAALITSSSAPSSSLHANPIARSSVKGTTVPSATHDSTPRARRRARLLALRQHHFRPSTTSSTPELHSPVHLPPPLADRLQKVIALTPPHMPIPLYATHPSISSEVFHKPTPTPAGAWARGTMWDECAPSAMRDHLKVTSAFSHPALWTSLYGPERQASRGARFSDEDGEAFLARAMGEAGVRSRLGGEKEWNDILARLGDGSSKTQGAQSVEGPQPVSAFLQPVSGQAQADVQGAVDGLQALLGRLDVAENDEVRMDSVKRKRKKKISKHKYRKRRKATRAQRKRLGK